MLECPADLAIIIGGYNSSNTSHLVELCEDVLPSYHIDHPDRILDNQSIQHFFFRTKEETISTAYLPSKNPVTIALTAGASCPDALMEAVIRKIASFYGASNELDQWSAEWNLSANH
jgi:4-hydroxy-3-methylbut-2-enyl diphosphate reductase